MISGVSRGGPYRHFGTASGLVLGFGLSLFAEMLFEGKYDGNCLTTILAVVLGAFGLGIHITRD